MAWLSALRWWPWLSCAGLPSSVRLQCAALFRATVLALRERPIPASFAPLGVYIYAVGSESCRNRLTLEGSARLAAQNKVALGTLGSWANGTCVRLSLRGKARLLPRAASTVRSAILRRRDTASLSRLRPVAHHANCRRAVPLRSLLTHAPLARPSAMARFSSHPLRSPTLVGSLNYVSRKCAYTRHNPTLIDSAAQGHQAGVNSTASRPSP